MSFLVWPILIFQLIFLIWALGKWDERDYFKTMHGAYAVINYLEILIDEPVSKLQEM